MTSQRAKRLSSSQKFMLGKITGEWQSIWDVGAANSTNMTLRALERAGEVILRRDPDEPRFFKWQVRLATEGASPSPMAAVCIIPNCGRTAPAAQPFCAQHRDYRHSSVSDLLKEARWYVNDALEAHEHSDGRALLVRIDYALGGR